MFLFVDFADNYTIGRSPNLAAIHPTVKQVLGWWLVLRVLGYFVLQRLYTLLHKLQRLNLKTLAVSYCDHVISRPLTRMLMALAALAMVEINAVLGRI